MINDIWLHNHKPWAIHGWDWKEESRLGDLKKVEQMFAPQFTKMKVFNLITNSDEYAVVLAPLRTPSRSVRKIYNDFLKELEDTAMPDVLKGKLPNWKKVPRT